MWCLNLSFIHFTFKEAGKGFLLHAHMQSTHTMTNMLTSDLNIAMVHN